MKKERLFIHWLLAIIIASVLLVFLKPQETINNIIQAIAIITLVFVTWVYAKRTGDLVEQEKKTLEENKKKKDADYWEKRINEFYQPFIVKLNNIKEELYNEQRDTKKMNELRNDAQCFFWKKKYMISQETVKKIEKLQLTIFQAELDRRKKSFKKYYEAEKEVRTTINNEWNEIEDKIRKFYSY